MAPGSRRSVRAPRSAARQTVRVAIGDLREMLGKRLLTGVSYLDAGGDVTEQVEFVGRVLSVDPLVAIDRGDGCEPFTLPPEPEAFDAAAPGEYRLRSSGEVVEDPDFLTTWTVTPPDR